MNQRILFNAGVLMAARLVGAVISFFLAPFMLLRLGAEPVGLLLLAASFSAASGFTSLMDLGVQPALVVFVARCAAREGRTSLSELVTTATGLFAVVGVLAGVVVLFVSNFLLDSVFKLSPDFIPTGRSIFQIMAVQVGVEFLGTVPMATLEGHQDYVLARGLPTITALLGAAATVTVIVAGFGIVGVALVQLAQATLTYGGLAVVMFVRFPQLSLRPTHFSKPLLRQLLSFSKPILGQRVSGIVFKQTDRLIVGSFLSVGMVAHYNIVQKVFTNIMLLQSFSPVVLPAASAALAMDDRSQLTAMFLRGGKYASALTGGAAIIVAVLMRPLLLHWFGADYVYLTLFAQAYVLMAVVAPSIGIGQAMMTPLGRAHEVMLFGLVSSMLSLVGSLVTVGRWQLAGIVWTTVLGAAVGWALNLRLIMSELGLRGRDLVVPLAVRSYLSLLLVVPLLMAALRLQMPRSLLEVGLYAALAMTAHALGFYFIGLDDEERGFVRRKLLLNWQLSGQPS